MNEPQDSKLFGVSARGWIAFTLVVTVCALDACRIPVDETIKHALTMTLGFYFGQKGSR